MTGMLYATQWGRVDKRWVWRGSVGGVYDWWIGAAVETGVGTVVDWTLGREGASGCCCCRCFFDVVVGGGGGADVGCLCKSAMKIGSCWWRV